MAAAMLFQIVPDNMQTQAAASSRKEGSRKAGDTTAALDGIAPVVTEETSTDLTGTITLTTAQESSLGTFVLAAAEEPDEEETQEPAAAEAVTTEGTEETEEVEETEETEEVEETEQTGEAEETAAAEPVPAESADVLKEEETAQETAAAAAPAADDNPKETASTEETAAEKTKTASAKEKSAEAETEDTAEAAEETVETVDPNVSTKNSSWTGQVLNSYVGAVYGPSGGKEVYYNMNMSQVVANLKSAGYEGDYWVRDDGVKMFGNYVMVAACYSVHPYGSFVETTLGTAIVCDTGTFAYSYPQMLDVAVTW